MNEKTSQNEFLTLSELLKFIWAKKIMVGIITLLTAVILLFLVLFINPKLETISFDVQVSFKSDSAQSYPNKDFYNYLNTVDISYLRATVNNNPGKYDNVNINGLVDEDYISVSLLENSAIETGNTVNQTLRLSIKSSFFNDTKHAQNFVRDLITTFENQVNLNETYTVVDSFVKAKDNDVDTYTYQDVIYSMESEYSNLLNHYNSLIDQNSNLTFKGTGKYANMNIRQIRQILEQRKAELGIIKHTVNKNKYFKNREMIESRIDILAAEIEINDILIDALTKSTTNSSNLNYLTTLIMETQFKKQHRDFLLEILNNDSLNPTHDFAEYRSNMDELVLLTQTFNDLYRTHMNSRSMIRFINNKNGVSSGSISPVLAVLGGLILGFGISSVIAVNMEYKKRNKITA